MRVASVFGVLLAVPAAGLTTVGCVGDSITFGVGASCPPCQIKPTPLQPCGSAGCAHSWPAQLQALLGGSSHRVWNWGHVAATMQSTTNCARGDPRSVHPPLRQHSYRLGHPLISQYGAVMMCRATLAHRTGHAIPPTPKAHLNTPTHTHKHLHTPPSPRQPLPSSCGGRNCSKGTGPPSEPCHSNGPPYWVTAEFKAATNRSAPLDAVVIMLGTNDAKQSNWLDLGNESQYAADAARMVRTFQTLPQQPTVFLSTPPPLYHATYTMNQTVVGSVMPRILRQVAARTGCEFIDMVNPLGGWPGLTMPELFLPNATNGGCDVPKGSGAAGCKGDGCHPDDLGHHRIAEVVAAALARVQNQ